MSVKKVIIYFLTPEEILQDIYGNYISAEDYNDFEAEGSSGRRYRFLPSNDYISVMWCPNGDAFDWDNGGEFDLRDGEKGFKTLLAYLYDFS